MRYRFTSWWHFGYNNAFAADTERPGRQSVGLGGTICGVSLLLLLACWLLLLAGLLTCFHGIQALQECRTDSPQDATVMGTKDSSGWTSDHCLGRLSSLLVAIEVSSVGCDLTNVGDVGNGSLMRLAPVPLYYVAKGGGLELCMQAAADSSRTTHQGQAASALSSNLRRCALLSLYQHQPFILVPTPTSRSIGVEAAECCRLLAFLLYHACHSELEDPSKLRTWLLTEAILDFASPKYSVRCLAESKVSFACLLACQLIHLFICVHVCRVFLPSIALSAGYASRVLVPNWQACCQQLF
jgi:hypothetical protein